VPDCILSKAFLKYKYKGSDQILANRVRVWDRVNSSELSGV
jgi:hypothetical protein